VNSLSKKDIEGLVGSSLRELELSIDSRQNDDYFKNFKYNNFRGVLIRGHVFNL
jgi:hypothetical protein